MTRNRTWWLVAAAAAAIPAALWADALRVRLDADQLRFAAPSLNFLTGRPLERLKNGAGVHFDLHLTLWADSRSTVRHRAAERFTLSYDLWEEKFSVAHWRNPRSSASHLTPAAAQSWCLDRLSLPASDLPPGRNFWVRLEVRAADPAEPPMLEGSILNLTQLIELLSRPGRAGQNRWSAEAGPLRIEDLKR